jgi:hypothetical protein
MNKHMIAGVLFVAVLLAALIVSPALAAKVTTQSSGIARGSLSHIFTYDPADTKVVVTDVAPGDVLQVRFGPDNRSSVRYYLQTRTAESWDYHIIGRHDDLNISLKERVPVDLSGDGTVELYLEYTSFQDLRGTFTFYNAQYAGTENTSGENPINVSSNDTGIPAKNETANVTAPIALPPIETAPPALPAENETVPGTSETSAPAEKSSLNGLAVTLIIVLIAVIVLLLTYLSFRKPGKPKQNEKRQAKREGKRIDDGSGADEENTVFLKEKDDTPENAFEDDAKREEMPVVNPLPKIISESNMRRRR